MSLQNALGNSLFVHLEEIAKRYHIEYYYYFDPEYAKKTGDNSEYFILFHEQYREKIENGNIPELYMQQKGKYYVGWHVFKIDEYRPFLTIEKVIHFARFAELVYGMFDRYDLSVPEQESGSFRPFLVVNYRDGLNEKRDKLARYFTENMINNHIKYYYDKEREQDFRKWAKSKGYKYQTTEEELTINVPITNKNCISIEELDKKYDSVSYMTLDSNELKAFEKEMAKIPSVYYSRTMPYVQWDNRTYMVDGKRFDGSSGEDIYGVSTIYYPKKYGYEVYMARHLAVYPFLKQHQYTKIDTELGVGEFALGDIFIEAVDRKFAQYGIAYKIDPQRTFHNFEAVSILISGKDVPMANLILEEIIKDTLNHHIFQPQIEYYLYPEIQDDVNEAMERKAKGIPHPYPTGREAISQKSHNQLEQKEVPKEKKGFFGLFKK